MVTSTPAPARTGLRRVAPDPGERARGGRPRDPGATVRVIEATQALLEEQGATVSMESIASRAAVGKATIYRRWATSGELIADAVLASHPLPAAPEPPADARAQLASLLQRLTEPLCAAELTVAAALAHSARDPHLRRATDAVLLAPLRQRVRDACTTAGATDGSAIDLVVSVVEGLWVRRFLLTPPPLAATEVRTVVDEVLDALTPR